MESSKQSRQSLNHGGREEYFHLKCLAQLESAQVEKTQKPDHTDVYHSTVPSQAIRFSLEWCPLKLASATVTTVIVINVQSDILCHYIYRQYHQTRCANH